MDRQTALDELELIRPDANEFQDPDFAEAVAYLETDASAREVFLRRQKLDRQIAEAAVNVPVPEGLKERLLEALDEEPATEKVALTERPFDLKSRRRWLISVIAAVACGLFAVFGLWWFHEPEPKFLALQEIELTAPYSEEEIAGLEPFHGEFEPALPGDLWSSPLRFTYSPPKGFAPDRAGSDRVAVYEYTFRDPERPGAGEKRGVLLVVPKSLLDSAPAGGSFFSSAYKTVSTKPTVAIRSWSENNLVYISMTEIEDDEALGEALVPANVG